MTLRKLRDMTKQNFQFRADEDTVLKVFQRFSVQWNPENKSESFQKLFEFLSSGSEIASGREINSASAFPHSLSPEEGVRSEVTDQPEPKRPKPQENPIYLAYMKQRARLRATTEALAEREKIHTTAMQERAKFKAEIKRQAEGDKAEREFHEWQKREQEKERYRRRTGSNIDPTSLGTEEWDWYDQN